MRRWHPIRTSWTRQDVHAAAVVEEQKVRLFFVFVEEARPHPRAACVVPGGKFVRVPETRARVFSSSGVVGARSVFFRGGGGGTTRTAHVDTQRVASRGSSPR